MVLNILETLIKEIKLFKIKKYNMTQEQFEEYKLIHNFLYPNDPLKPWINKTNIINLFKEDWNELMLVVDKIHNLKPKTNVSISDHHCYIYLVYTEDRKKVEINDWHIINAKKSTIEVTYEAILEFIKWYNKQKQ